MATSVESDRWMTGRPDLDLVTFSRWSYNEKSYFDIDL
jgi:hypothetical protein